ncbi:MAG: hypothetical protein JJU28_05680 [Cyclobacteriaceae bacterium]|nr:hypothetical protein [Cyclobacteriaceae bacterium]
MEEVILVPKPGIPKADLFVKHAEEDYGINRKELKTLRYEICLSYSTARLTVESDQVPQALRKKTSIKSGP